MTVLVIGIVIVAQGGLMAFLIFGGLFGGVGFDHRGSSGLDVSRVISIVVLYLTLLLAGTTLAISNRR